MSMTSARICKFQRGTFIATALVFLLLLIPTLCFSQTYKLYKTKNYHNQLRLNTATGEVQQIQDDGQHWLICEAIVPSGENEKRFRLYQTENMWNFIMLDTYSGKTWQVQFSTDSPDYMFALPISIFSLAYPDADSNWTNRFQLIKTENMWNFILLDTYTGRLWQVQYSTDDLSGLMCLPINEIQLMRDSYKKNFHIEPMTSMYQFYLINDSTGEMWKFQWSTKGDDYRWIEKVQ